MACSSWIGRKTGDGLSLGREGTEVVFRLITKCWPASWLGLLARNLLARSVSGEVGYVQQQHPAQRPATQNPGISGQTGQRAQLEEDMGKDDRARMRAARNGGHMFSQSGAVVVARAAASTIVAGGLGGALPSEAAARVSVRGGAERLSISWRGCRR